VRLVKFRALFILLSLAATAGAQMRPPKPAPAKPAPAVKPVPPKPAPGKPAKPVEELDSSALGALKLLPKDAAKRVARIEAREGRPSPERWYVLVFDPSVPHGLREFVFTGGKMVTSRTLSQFADGLTKDDAVGAENIRINHDTAAGMAAQFAILNGKRLGSVDYELRKAAPGVALWRLTCTDSGGQPMGVLELHAGKGTVVSYEGFEKSPVAAQPLPVSKAALASAKNKDGKPGTKGKPEKPTAEKPGGEKPTTQKPVAESPATEKPATPKPSTDRPSADKPVAEARPTEIPEPEKPVVHKSPTEKPVAEHPFGDRPFTPATEKPPAEKTAAERPAAPKPEPTAKKPAPVAEPPRAIPVARAVPAPEPTPAPGAVKRIGNSVKRLFGRDE
jgi:hypothetical protein